VVWRAGSVQAVHDRLKSRKALYVALAPYTAPTVCTLHLDAVRHARSQRLPHSLPAAASAGADEAPALSGAAASSVLGSGGGGGAAGGGAIADGDEAPVRLTLESYPEISQLPLEYQGYCCVTLVNGSGLLLPGDPSLGIVRYHGRYMVFATEKAVAAFLVAPSKYTQGAYEQEACPPPLSAWPALPPPRLCPPPSHTPERWFMAGLVPVRFCAVLISQVGSR
jgi:hypothetical protein